MTKSERAELERLVQGLDRAHPEWTAADMEADLASLASVAFGNWKDDTPQARSRARQIQRWRRGDRGNRSPAPTPHRFTQIWVVGESQRHLIDGRFPPRPAGLRATHRIYVRNLANESLREIHVRLANREVLYEPSLEAGGFAEIYWSRVEEIRSTVLRASEGTPIDMELEVDFCFQSGLRNGRLSGSLHLDPSDGWRSFSSSDGVEKELE